jgi:hypothetical protein
VYGQGEEAQRAAHVSDSFFLSLKVDDPGFQPWLGLVGVLGFSIPPFSSQILTFEATSDAKFKLLTVSSC